MGSFQQQFNPEKIDSNFHCQVFCIREKQNHPQLLATNRHISCGALELKNCPWNNNTLEGTSDLTNGDGYTIYIHEPDNFRFKKFSCDGGEIIANKKEGEMRLIPVRSSAKSLERKAAY